MRPAKMQGRMYGTDFPGETKVYARPTNGRMVVKSIRLTKWEVQVTRAWMVMLSVRGPRDRERLKKEAFASGIARNAPIAIDRTPSPTF